MTGTRAVLIWSGLALAIVLPVTLAAYSPLLAWRQGVYIGAGFAGIVALALMLLQPLLAVGYLPYVSERYGRRLHMWLGLCILLSIALHVAGLWITSPPDVVDALLFRSPTPFSAWGVIAMWAILLGAGVALLRRRLRLRWHTWRRFHTGLAALTVVTTAVHAVLIEGTMEQFSKFALCALVLAVTAKVLFDIRIWRRRARHSVSGGNNR